MQTEIIFDIRIKDSGITVYHLVNGGHTVIGYNEKILFCPHCGQEIEDPPPSAA